tara:strand:- start:764 stop:1000 length:237 start_codon:yes stop_codon:yes gene_type:complete
MELIDISENLKVSAGEYIYHRPTEQIVVCGGFNRDSDLITAMARGSILRDKISNFQKIKMTREERKAQKAGGCKGCKK